MTGERIVAASKEIQPERQEQEFNFKKALIFFAAGALFAALPYIFSSDYIFYRFPLYAFIGFHFGSRAGLLSTLPTMLAAIIVPPTIEAATQAESLAYMALMFSAPLTGYLAAIIRKLSDLQRKLLPILAIFFGWLAYELYFFLSNKPNYIRVPFIFVVAICGYFIFKYIRYLSYIKTFMWLLVLHYLAGLMTFMVYSRFTLPLNDYYNPLLYLVPGDLLAVFLGAVLFPNLEVIIKKREKSIEHAEDEN